MGPSDRDLVVEGQAAIRAGDWATALDCFRQVGGPSPLPDALEGIAEALYVKADYAAAGEHYERAFSARRRAGDAVGAGRCARMLSWIYGNLYGDWAVSGGWLGRACDVLEESDSPAALGWLELARAETEADLDVRQSRLRRAREIGRRTGDPGMETEALGWLGLTDVFAGRVRQGLGRLDQALAAVCAGEVDDLYVIEGSLCGMLWGCELAQDVARAEQWVRVANGLRAARGLSSMAAFCLAHQGAILTAAGRWGEAETVLTSAHRMFPDGMTRMTSRALTLLAELRLRQGRLEEAAELLAGLDRDPDALRPLAELHLARGDLALARAVLDRALTTPVVASSDVPLLGLAVELAIREGSHDLARAAGTRLGELARSGGEPVRAMAALAQARVALANGTGDARAWFDEAIDAFTRTLMPLDAAIARLDLARLLSDEHSEVAVAEAKAALAEFERLGAARHADDAGALLRELGAPIRTGPKGTGALTRRESEVLALLGAGLSNAEIGDRLFITRKTVEHHVGNVLAKLGLRNRAEAAAFATRERLAAK